MPNRLPYIECVTPEIYRDLSNHLRKPPELATGDSLALLMGAKGRNAMAYRAIVYINGIASLDNGDTNLGLIFLDEDCQVAGDWQGSIVGADGRWLPNGLAFDSPERIMSISEGYLLRHQDDDLGRYRVANRVTAVQMTPSNNS